MFLFFLRCCRKTTNYWPYSTLQHIHTCTYFILSNFTINVLYCANLSFICICICLYMLWINELELELEWTVCLIPLPWLFGKFSLDSLGHDKGYPFIEMFFFKFLTNFEKAHFLLRIIFGESFMRITYKSAYDILGTVQPDNENLIRIWIIWIQKVSILEIAPFFAF